MNVVNVDKSDDGMLMYGCPQSVYNKILGLVLDEDYGEAILGPTGRDVVIMYDNTRQGSEKYQVQPRKEGLSKKMSTSWSGEVIDMYSPEAESGMAEGSIEEGMSVPDADAEPDVHAPKKKLESKDTDEDVKPLLPPKKEEEDNDDVEDIFGKQDKKKAPAKAQAVEADEEVVLEPPKKKKK